jgi:hypothetical protein
MYTVTWTSDEADGRTIEATETDPMATVRLLMAVESDPAAHPGAVYASAEDLARLDELVATLARGKHVYRDVWKVSQV